MFGYELSFLVYINIHYLYSICLNANLAFNGSACIGTADFLWLFIKKLQNY